MAVYVYACEGCHIKVDIKKPMSEFERAEACSKCGKDMQRLITETTFILKGGGWAKDNYSSNRSELTIKYKDGRSERVPYDPKKTKAGAD